MQLKINTKMIFKNFEKNLIIEKLQGKLSKLTRYEFKWKKI